MKIMKYYNVNNIIEYSGKLCVIYESTETGMWIRWRKEIEMGTILFLTELETEVVKDVEISDWLLDRVFKRVEGKEIWSAAKDIDQYWITIKHNRLPNSYSFSRWGKEILTISTIRQLQNLYNFWREYEENFKIYGEDLLFVDLDSELQKLFNL